MAIKTLCEAGLKVCALNAGRRLDPEKDFRNPPHALEHEVPRLRRSQTRAANPYGYMDNEYTEAASGSTKSRTPPRPVRSGRGRVASPWAARRISGAAVVGAFRRHRFPRRRRSTATTWTGPLHTTRSRRITRRVEQMIGVASTVQNRPSNPDGEYLPPMNFRCIDRILGSWREQNWRALSAGPHRAAHRRRTTAIPHATIAEIAPRAATSARFSPRRGFFLPGAEATKNLELRTNALAKNILVDENGHASGVAYIDRNHEAGSRSLRPRGGCGGFLRGDARASC